MSVDLPVLTLVFMWIAAVLCLAVPFMLMIILKKKGADILPFFIGFAVFLIFALLIEGLINYAVSRSAIWPSISANIPLYALYGGLMAGLFEETGRFLAFKTVLKRKLGNDRNALMYGAGHGGFEAIMLVSVNYITYSVMMILNSMGVLSKIMPEDALSQIVPVLDEMLGIAPSLILVSVLERVSAIAAHIAFSVFVWFGAKNGRKVYLFPAAILLHALYDIAAVMASQYFGLSILAVEGVIAACSVLLVFAAWRVWKANTVQE